MKDHDSNATDPLDPADPVNRDSVSDSWGRAAAYDAYADGLHTYALGGLRHHEAASSAVYCAFVAADHHVAHLGDAEMLRPWLYAITRHYCRAGKLPRLRLTAAPVPAPKDAAMAELERTLLSAELASLDWPDTDGLSAAHREVLELSVRHGMESRAVGMMLGKPAAESFEVLSQAWHELERSLAALALLRTSRSHCPDLAALAQGWSGRLTAQRREPLVAHVDACSRCQYHLHKVIGAPQAPSILPHVPAPKELRERVLGDLLDTGPEKAAEKAAIATRLTHFDESGFPVIATMRPPARPQAQPHQRPRTAAPMPVERRSRRLGALLAGRVSSAAAEAVAGEVASAPGRLRTPVSASVDAKTPANAMDEGSGLDAAALSAGNDRRGWLRPAADSKPRQRGGAADGDPHNEQHAELHNDQHNERHGSEPELDSLAPDPFGGLAAELSGTGFERGPGPVVSAAEESVGAGKSSEVLAALHAEDLDESFGPRPTEADSTEVLAALRSEDLDASFGPSRNSSVEDTLITARTERRSGVFDDIRPARPVPSRGPVPRNSVAAAVEGRRRGVEDVRRGAAPVGDAYEAAASVAAAMAAGDAAGAEVPPIAPVGVMPTSVMPLGMLPGGPSHGRATGGQASGGRVPQDATRVFARPLGAPPDQRKRKSGVKSAIASSAVLSGVGAAGVTAFVLFVPSSPGNNKTLFTPPDAGGSASQTPDYPRPSSSADAGPALPVAGNVHSAGLPGNDTVTAQVVAAPLPTTPSSPAAGTTSAGLPFNGPMSQLPSQSDSPSPDPGGDGRLHISVTQRSNNPNDVEVMLWNSGTDALSWTASPDAAWLSLSATSGMLAGGAQTSIHVLVAASAEPSGAWTAHVRFDPSGQMVSIKGVGGSGGGTSGTPSTSPSSGPTSGPTTPPSSSPSGTPSGTPTSPVSTPSTPHSSPSTSGASSGSQGGPSGTGPSSPGSPGSSGSSSSGPSRGPSSPSTPGSSDSSGSPSSSTPSTAPGTQPTKPGRRRH